MRVGFRFIRAHSLLAVGRVDKGAFEAGRSGRGRSVGHGHGGREAGVNIGVHPPC
jgi:hypothetical protein